MVLGKLSQSHIRRISLTLGRAGRRNSKKIFAIESTRKLLSIAGDAYAFAKPRLQLALANSKRPLSWSYFILQILCFVFFTLLILHSQKNIQVETANIKHRRTIQPKGWTWIRHLPVRGYSPGWSFLIGRSPRRSRLGRSSQQTTVPSYLSTFESSLPHWCNVLIHPPLHRSTPTMASLTETRSVRQP